MLGDSSRGTWSKKYRAVCAQCKDAPKGNNAPKQTCKHASFDWVGESHTHIIHISIALGAGKMVHLFFWLGTTDFSFFEAIVPRYMGIIQVFLLKYPRFGDSNATRHDAVHVPKTNILDRIILSILQHPCSVC